MSTFQRFSPVCGVREMDSDVVCKIPNFLAGAQSTTRRVSEREFKEAGKDYKGNRRLGMGAWNSNCSAPVEHFFDVPKESFYFALHCQCHGSSMFFFPTQNTELKSMKAMEEKLVEEKIVRSTMNLDVFVISSISLSVPPFPTEKLWCVYTQQLYNMLAGENTELSKTMTKSNANAGRRVGVLSSLRRRRRVVNVRQWVLFISVPRILF